MQDLYSCLYRILNSGRCVKETNFNHGFTRGHAACKSELHCFIAIFHIRHCE